MMMSLFLTLALADVPPEPGYVETCTPEQACPGRASGVCSAWYGGSEECEPYRAKGWEKACQTRGASTWQEVWCAPGGAAPAPLPPARRCGVVPWDAAAVGVLAGMVAVAARRRR